ncbi:MAG: hypothetical protein ACP5RM_02900 [Candidatus Micrarchaeia archaeon]
MTRAQLSVEFMVYAAASAASLAVVLAGFGAYSGIASGYSNSIYKNSFYSALYSNMPYYYSSFTAFIPKDLCGNSMHNTLLNNSVIVSNSVCADNGTVQKLSMIRSSNSTFYVSVVR